MDVRLFKQYFSVLLDIASGLKVPEDANDHNHTHSATGAEMANNQLWLFSSIILCDKIQDWLQN